MIFLAASFVFLLDRLVKGLVLAKMAFGQSIEVLPGIFRLTFIANNGTAFGLFKGQNTTLGIVSAVIAALIIMYALRHKGKVGFVISASLGLILGGALGNLFDRILYGYVIDFFDFRVWPVFNVADSAITVGTVILALYYASHLN